MTQNMHSIKSSPPPETMMLPPQSPRSSSPRPRSLMESILVAKMDKVAVSCTPGRSLVRTDSADSTSSWGSLPPNMSDICRCDDCLLGIVDLYALSPQEINKQRKKELVVHPLWVLLPSGHINKLFLAVCMIWTMVMWAMFGFTKTLPLDKLQEQKPYQIFGADYFQPSLLDHLKN